MAQIFIAVKTILPGDLFFPPTPHRRFAAIARGKPLPESAG